MLPGIEITYQNGALGQVVPSPDGCVGLVCMADEVATTFVHETPYIVKSMKDVATLGITDSIGNHRLYKFLSEFFAEGGTGRELWLMAFAKTSGATPVLMSALFTPISGVIPAQKLLDAANGKIRILNVLFNPDAAYVPTVTAGIDADVTLCVSKLQTMLDDYTNTKFAPAFAIVDGYAFDGTPANLTDYAGTGAFNRVAILLGDSEKRTGTTASKGTALGLLAGRLAKNNVQINIGKVIDGPVSSPEVYILDTPVSQFDVESIHDKGFITFRNWVGKTGCYLTDDPLLVEATDDYSHITARRTIDKAFRIAYDVMIDFVLSEFNLMPNGALSPIDCKTIEGRLIGAIASQMTANNELSVDVSDEKDTGVQCKVSTTHNVAADSKLQLDYLQVRPKGYARYVNVPLGFVPIQ